MAAYSCHPHREGKDGEGEEGEGKEENINVAAATTALAYWTRVQEELVRIRMRLNG